MSSRLETPTQSMLYGNTASTISIYKPRIPADLAGTNSSIGSLRGSSRGSHVMIHEITQQIRDADRLKHEAVNEENYALAKRAKRTKAQLELVLRQMREVERQKRMAEARDDFDRAEDMAARLRVLRENANRLAGVDELALRAEPAPPSETASSVGSLPRIRVDRVPLTPSTAVSQPYQAGSTIAASTTTTTTTTSPNLIGHLLPPLTPSTVSNPSTVPIYRPQLRPQLQRQLSDPTSDRVSHWLRESGRTVAPQPSPNKYWEKENQVLPGVARQINTNAPKPSLDQLLDEVSAGERPIVTNAANVFGVEPVGLVYSKLFKDRVKGLSGIVDGLQKTQATSDPRAAFRAALPILVKGLNDQIYSVYEVSTELLLALAKFLDRYSLMANEAGKLADDTYQVMVSRTGDTVTDRRFADTTYEANRKLMKLADRLSDEYLKRYMKPWSKNQLDTRRATRFGVKCMQHPDANLKNIGRDIILYLFHNGNQQEVRAALPTRSAELSRSLRALLDSLDGLGPRTSSEPSMASRKSETGSTRRSARTAKSSTRSGSRHSNHSLKSIMANPEKKAKNNDRNVKIQLDNSKNSDSSTVDYSKVCMYCGALNPSLNLTGLEQHYNKDCPMLTKCPSCGEVVETRHLNDHLARDCKRKADYTVCDRCDQAVLSNLYSKHRSSKRCRLKGAEVGRCPLCGEDVTPDNDIGWREHLMTRCAGNGRLRRGAAKARQRAQP